MGGSLTRTVARLTAGNHIATLVGGRSSDLPPTWMSGGTLSRLAPDREKALVYRGEWVSPEQFRSRASRAERLRENRRMVG